MNKQQRSRTTWHQRRLSALLLCTVALGIAYGVGSLAVNSGSLQQYFLTAVVLVYALNRFGYAFMRRRVR